MFSLLRTETIRNRAIALMPLLAAAMLCCCLTTEAGSYCSFVAIVPLVIVFVARDVPRSIYASSFLAGLAVHLWGMAWVLDCYRYQNAVGPYFVQWFWIGCCGGALFLGLVAIGRHLFQRWAIPATILLPAVWVTFEFIRHHSGAVIAKTDFPWMKLGTVLVDFPRFVQIADLGGEYLLSFLVAMINGAIADCVLLWRSKKYQAVNLRSALAVPVCLLLIVATYGYGAWRLNQSTGIPGPTVGLMGELDLPPLLTAERLTGGFGGNELADHHADLLLWPELAYHHAIVENESRIASNRNILQVGYLEKSEDGLAQRYLEQSARELGSTLVIGCERKQTSVAGTSIFNSLACVSSQKDIWDLTIKSTLCLGLKHNARRLIYLLISSTGVEMLVEFFHCRCRMIVIGLPLRSVMTFASASTFECWQVVCLKTLDPIS